MNRSLSIVGRNLCKSPLLAPRTSLLAFRAASSKASPRAPSLAARELKWQRDAIFDLGTALHQEETPIMQVTPKRGRPTIEEVKRRKRLIELDLGRRKITAQRDSKDGETPSILASSDISPKSGAVGSTQLDAVENPSLKLARPVTPKSKKAAQMDTTEDQTGTGLLICGVIAGIVTVIFAPLTGSFKGYRYSIEPGNAANAGPTKITTSTPITTEPLPRFDNEVATDLPKLDKTPLNDSISESTSSASNNSLDTGIPSGLAARSETDKTSTGSSPYAFATSPRPSASIKPWQYLPWISIRVTMRVRDLLHGIYVHLIQIWLPYYYVERILSMERDRMRALMAAEGGREGPKEMKMEVKWK